MQKEKSDRKLKKEKKPILTNKEWSSQDRSSFLISIKLTPVVAYFCTFLQGIEHFEL